MCTVTFIPVSERSYVLGSNRDELKTRQAAIPPEIQKPGNWIAPIDTQAGGTWIGSNNSGMTFTLINNYQAINPILDHKENAKSRGLIIPKLMQVESLQEADEIMQNLKVEKYNTFELIGVSVAPLQILRWSWDGVKFEAFQDTVDPRIWVSAGFDLEKVTSVRKQIFTKLIENFGEKTLESAENLVLKYQTSQEPERGKFSVAMFQEKVQTVSSTVIAVGTDEMKYRYCDGFPQFSDVWQLTRMNIK